MSMSGFTAMSEPPRRFDVFTGTDRRRSFTAAEKAAIVAESYAGEDSVCGVARRHGLTPRQLFTWRRLARAPPSRSAERPLFVPVIVSPDAAAAPNEGRRRARAHEGVGAGRVRPVSSSRWVASWCGSAAMPTRARSRR